MLCQGLGNIDTLTIQQDITCARATNTTISTNKNLTLKQTGDQLVNGALHLRNRINEASVAFETAIEQLVDFIFKHAGGQRNIRLEGRGQFVAHGANTWQIGGNFAPSTLQVGDDAASFAKPLSLTDCTCSGAITASNMTSAAATIDTLTQMPRAPLP